MIDSSKVTMEQAQAMFEESKKRYDDNESVVASLSSVIHKVKRFCFFAVNYVNYDYPLNLFATFPGE